MMTNFSGQRVAILGFGVEGRDATDFFLSRGARVTVFDEKDASAFDPRDIDLRKDAGAEFSFGNIAPLTQFDLIIRSPGIRPDSSQLNDARERRVTVTSATNLFFDLCPCPIVGITGTKGKGTTASLLAEMLKTDGKDAHLAGNIGTPMLSLLEKLSPSSVVILELSSFQLMDATKSPHISVVLMVTREHLDYHAGEPEYVSAKSSIVAFQTQDDVCVVNSDYPNSASIASRSKAKKYSISTNQSVEEGCFIQDSKLVLRVGEAQRNLMDAKDVFIPGRHNLENACAAAMTASVLGCSDASIVTTLKTFKGLEHRLEFVRELRGVRYYNDSYSSIPESAIAAMQAFQQPIILILGGSPKGSDFRELGNAIAAAKNIKAIVGIGQEWPRIRAVMTLADRMTIIENQRTMHDIVQAAHELAQPGDIVVLSPACASFDMFKNYKDRGSQFKAQVVSLKE